MKWPGIVVAVSVGLFALPSEALMRLPPHRWNEAPPSPPPVIVPITRVERNLQASLRARPNDAELVYEIGRLHYYQFLRPVETVEVEPCSTSSSTKKHERCSPWYIWREEKTDASMTERLRHLEAGILSLRRATELSPSRGLYWNTLAAALWETSGAGSLLTASEGLPPGDDALKLSVSDLDRTRAVALVAQRMTTPWNMIASELFQSVCQSARALSVGVLPPFLPDDMMLRADLTRRCWVERSISAYAQAYKLGRAEEGDRVDDGFGPSARFVTREAGEAVLRLIHERGVREDDWPTLYAVETELERAGQDIPRAISPIILSLESAQPMAALTSSAVVSFDLDGTGSARWTWVKPSTGILVWDPERKGQITSGLQLFGSVTFWMFWRNGYVALDTLDDNRDGWLTEAELTGLGIWFDRNSNGVSDPGEVVPVARVGVAGLATHEDGREGEGWVSVHGVRMTDGRTLPTYDWIAHRVDEVADGSQVLQCAATDGE